VVSYWLDLGLDGFLCDAAPYFFEREGIRNTLSPSIHRDAAVESSAAPLNHSHHITLPDVGFSVLFELAVERLAIYAKEICGFLLFAFGEL
jgi:hypothetical protein